MLGNKGLAVYQPFGKQIMMRMAEQALRLPLTQLTVFYFLVSFLFVKVYKPLLHLFFTIGWAVSYLVAVNVTRIVILCYFSLKIASILQLILVRKLRREALDPVVHILQHSWAAVRKFGFNLGSALQYYAAKWVLKLLFSVLKRGTLPTVSSAWQGLHHSTHPFLQENSEAYQTLLRPIMKQIITALFLGILDGVREAFYLPVQIVKHVVIQLFVYRTPQQHSTCKESISEDITCVLPRTRISLSRRFKGPATLVHKNIPPSFAALQFVVATECIVSGLGKYGLDFTNIPLHVRFQNNIRMKNECSSMQQNNPAVKLIKASCAVFLGLYLSVISSIIKNNQINK